MLTPDELDYPAGGTPPSVVDVGTLDGGVGVVFSTAVSAATALNPANYTVTGTTVTNVTFISVNYVLLGVSKAPANPFTVTVKDVANLGGDVMPAAQTVTAPPTAGGTITDGLVAYGASMGICSIRPRLSMVPPEAKCPWRSWMARAPHSASRSS